MIFPAAINNIQLYCRIHVYCIYSNGCLGDYCFPRLFGTKIFDKFSRISRVSEIYERLYEGGYYSSNVYGISRLDLITVHSVAYPTITSAAAESLGTFINPSPYTFTCKISEVPQSTISLTVDGTSYTEYDAREVSRTLDLEDVTPGLYQFTCYTYNADGSDSLSDTFTIRGNLLCNKPANTLDGIYQIKDNYRHIKRHTVNSRYIEVQGTWIFLRYNRVFVIKGWK